MRYEAVLDGKINCLEEGGEVVIIVYGGARARGRATRRRRKRRGRDAEVTKAE